MEFGLCILKDGHKMNDVDLKVLFVHLKVDVLHIHLVQVYQRLVLECYALFDVLHLEVSLET